MFDIENRRNRVGRQDPHARNGPRCPSGRRRRSRDPRRNRRPLRGHRRQVRQARPGLLPADRPLPGKILGRRAHPGRLLQARARRDRKGNADQPPDRPPDPPAVPGRLLQRGPRDRAGPVLRRRERARHRGDDRRLGRADHLRRSLHGPDRRRPRRLQGRRIYPQPDRQRKSPKATSTSSSPARPNAVMMVESEAKELSEDVMLGAVMFAHAASQEGLRRRSSSSPRRPPRIRGSSPPATTRPRPRPSSRS